MSIVDHASYSRRRRALGLSGWAAATVVFCQWSWEVSVRRLLAMIYQVKWLAPLLVTLFISIAAGQTQLPDEITSASPSTPPPPTPSPLPKLPLAVHYEALCPDSIYFIRRRLYDALLDNDWWNRTDLKLYPFGKAAVSGRDSEKISQVQLFSPDSSITTLISESWKCFASTGTRSASWMQCMPAFWSIWSCGKPLTWSTACCAPTSTTLMSVPPTWSSTSQQSRSASARARLPIFCCPMAGKLWHLAYPLCPALCLTMYARMSYNWVLLSLPIFIPLSILFALYLLQNFQPYEQSSIRYNFEGHFCRQYQQKFKIKLPTCA